MKNDQQLPDIMARAQQRVQMVEAKDKVEAKVMAFQVPEVKSPNDSSKFTQSDNANHQYFISPSTMKDDAGNIYEVVIPSVTISNSNRNSF